MGGGGKSDIFGKIDFYRKRHQVSFSVKKSTKGVKVTFSVNYEKVAGSSLAEGRKHFFEKKKCDSHISWPWVRSPPRDFEIGRLYFTSSECIASGTEVDITSSECIK